ncbi:hypothetical protein [Actinomycetospora soli]|uniref:hypothetical protein n=1 Tax=Actinomycetospora soli TaxID=2893887 RepID=UPI001E57B214|nr:hypothetical protein [Actinomycetospora soli]MCD2190217.1 hypothetical protein [Actinomycetospora soli]
MADRSSCGTTNDRGVSEGGGTAAASLGRRVVALRPTVRRPSEPVPAWAGGGAATGAWTPADVPAAEAPAVEPLVPSGAALPFEPDPEAAAFLNAPRRPLAFYVAPFGTPPFGNPPTTAPRATVGGPEWGPAYPAGA